MLSSAGGALALALGTTLLLAFYLSPKELGILMTAEAFVGLFSLFFEFGFKNSIIKISAKHESLEEGLNTTVGNALLIKSIITLPLAILIYLASQWMHYDSLTSYILICYIVIFTSDNFSRIFGIVRRSLGQFKLMAFVNVFNPLLRIATVFIILGLLSGDLKLLVHFFLALSLMRFIISFFSTISFVKPKLDTSQIKEMFMESYKYGLFDFLEDLQTRVDRVMINYFIGPASVAFYAIPAKINRVVKIIPKTISQVFLPTLHDHYEKSDQKYKDVTKNLAKYIAIIGAFAFFAIFYFSEPVITKLYGDKYAESLQIVELFAFVSMAWLLNSTPGVVLATQSAHRQRIWAQVISTLANIILNFILIPKIGIVGAVYATLASNLIKLFIISYMTRDCIDNLKIIIITIIPITLALFLKYYFAIPLFLIAIVLTKTISEDDFNFAKNIISKR